MGPGPEELRLVLIDYPSVDVAYESKEGRLANGLPSFKSSRFCIHGRQRQLAERIIGFLFLRQRLV
jgi:hypothetical protein